MLVEWCAINNARSTVQIAFSVSVYRANRHASVDVVYHSSMDDYNREDRAQLKPK